jgi:hypothetical protein
MKELLKTAGVVFAVIIIVKVLDRLFLDSMLDKIAPSNFEDYENADEE